MRYTDMHTDDEIQSFQPRMRYEDAASGQIWDDPMPESDFESNPPSSIDFRTVRKPDFPPRCSDHDLLSSLPNPAKKKLQYPSQEEELAALRESMEKMQAQCLDEHFTPMTWGEEHSPPDPDDFRAWQRAARERGGNVTQDDSFYLPPVKLVDRDSPHVMPRYGDHNEDAPPHQFASLVNAHSGKWAGMAFVFAVSSESHFAVRQLAHFDVCSDVSVEDHGALQWTSVFTRSASCELVSNVTFDRPQHEEALVPGRGVSSDGSYVCSVLRADSPQQTLRTKSSAEGLSLSSKCLKALVADNQARGELELCMFAGRDRRNLRRDRVLLCSSSSLSCKKGKKKQPSNVTESRRFSHVVLMSEYQICNEEATDDAILSQSTQAYSSMDSFFVKAYGEWSGTAQLLQPEFPPLGFGKHNTSFTFQKSASITLDTVTWTEQDIPDVAEATSKARIRTLGKKKVSKRVAVARAHDQRRLSECSSLSTEQVGDTTKETFAWKEVRSEFGLSGLFSPRLGKFVHDYCGIFLPGGSILTFPCGNAFPDMSNTVCLVQLSSPIRKRINVARNQSGTIVGILFIKESLVNSDLCDDVSSYV